MDEWMGLRGMDTDGKFIKQKDSRSENPLRGENSNRGGKT